MAENVRIVVGVSGSLSSLAALHHAVEEARRLDAVLVPVLAWHPVGGESAYRSHPSPPLPAVWEQEQAARKRLHTAFEQCFGGYPEGLRIQPTVVRDEQPHGSVSRYCLAHARCAVTAVPPSELLDGLEAAARRGEPMTLPSRWTDAAHAA